MYCLLLSTLPLTSPHSSTHPPTPLDFSMLQVTSGFSFLHFRLTSFPDSSSCGVLCPNFELGPMASRLTSAGLIGLEIGLHVFISLGAVQFVLTETLEKNFKCPCSCFIHKLKA